MKKHNNQVSLIGTFEEKIIFSHEINGQKFFRMFLSVSRLSGTIDCIPVLISEKLELPGFFIGKRVQVKGEYHSYNIHDKNQKSHLLLFVFAQEIEEVSDDLQDDQKVILDGYTCKLTHFRKTPLGRKIADIVLAVNRPYNRSDYIPTIAWGKNAIYARTFPVGTHIHVIGRIQAREYGKKQEDGSYLKRIAYEFSISKMEVVD